MGRERRGKNERMKNLKRDGMEWMGLKMRIYFFDFLGSRMKSGLCRQGFMGNGAGAGWIRRARENSCFFLRRKKLYNILFWRVLYGVWHFNTFCDDGIDLVVDFIFLLKRIWRKIGFWRNELASVNYIKLLLIMRILHFNHN